MDSPIRKQFKESHQLSNAIGDINPNPTSRLSPQIQRRISNPSAHRAARLYWSNPDLHPTYTLPSPRSLDSESTSSNSNGGNLTNPLVMGSIAAGVVGVVIIAVIILGVWIRSRLLREDKLRRDVNHVDVESTVMSSMSSGINGNDNLTQMDSVNLDDTTFYSAVDESNVEFGDISQNQSVYYFKSDVHESNGPVEITFPSPELPSDYK